MTDESPWSWLSHRQAELTRITGIEQRLDDLEVLVQLAIVFDVPLPPILLWCLFGFFATWSLVYYAVLTAHFGAALAGRVNIDVRWMRGLERTHFLSVGLALAAASGAGDPPSLHPRSTTTSAPANPTRPKLMTAEVCKPGASCPRVRAPRWRIGQTC